MAPGDVQGGGEAGPRPSAVAPVAAGVAIGVVVLLAGLLLVRSPAADPSELTQNGAHNFRPERDALVYLSAAVTGVGAALALSRRRPGAAAGRLHLRLAVAVVVPAAAAVASCAAFVGLRDDAPLHGRSAAACAVSAVVLAALCAIAARAAPDRLRPPWPDPLDVPSGRRPLRPVDAVVPGLLLVLLWVPAWRYVAGNAVSGEGALHLDFFGLGPALSFRSGLAFGSEVHPYYGVGWAMVFARLNLLSYGELIRFEILYACAYFTGVYLLVRLMTGDRRWAAAGTVAAVLLQLFARWPAEFVLWRFPSATVLRWPFDVWVFLACLVQLRTRRPAWGVVAGALVGLAVVFQTETAGALGLGVAFWWVARWRSEGRAALRALPAALGAGAGVVVVGLGIASRWTLLSGDFWTGWLENVRLAARGATLLPIAGVESAADVVAFVAVTAVYLAFVAVAAVAVLRNRATTALVMVGSVALYGLVTFLYFVGRSNPHNLFRPAVPLAVVLATSAGLAWRAWSEARSPGRWSRAAPWAAVALVVAAVAATPSARAYPGVLRAAVADDPPPGLCLFEAPRDVCGLPPEFAGVSVAGLRDLAAALRELGAEGEPVAVVDEIGPVVPYMAGARAWGRYSPLFPTLFTREQRRAVIAELQEHPPRLLVMRARESLGTFYEDSWLAFRPVVEERYVLDRRVGSFEIWTLAPPQHGVARRD